MANSVVKEEDTLFYIKDGVTPDKGYGRLETYEDIVELAKVSRMTGVAKLHVHCETQRRNVEEEGSNAVGGNEDERINSWENIELGGDDWEGEGDLEAPDKVQGRKKKFTARKRVSKTVQSAKKTKKDKQKVVDEESDDFEESEEEDSEYEVEIRDDCSDSELTEMRKIREEIRKENEAIDKEQSQIIRETLRQLGSKYNDYDSNSTGGSMDSLYYEDSEDEDEKVAYAEPPAYSKKPRVNKVFNKKTAGKYIRWKAGLVFESKKELKDAVREFSIALGDL